jgi:protein arginine kinase activator
MLCSICHKNEATVHLTEIVDDKIQKLDLCEPCSKEKGVDDPAAFSLSSVFADGGNKDADADFAEEDVTGHPDNEDSDAEDKAKDKQAETEKKKVVFSGKITGLQSLLTQEDGKACPNCKYTLTQFKKTGRMGCPVCYATFKDVLESALKNMHKGTRHIGKAPAGIKERLDLSQKLEEFEERLREAIALENFEDAAILRDQIKDLKVKLKTAETED